MTRSSPPTSRARRARIPSFYFGGQSQGAEGRIYPYPLYNNLTNEKGEKTYHLVYLENEYVRIAVAPEIGGRLLSAVDKTDQYDFIYHQHVIKPALIGLIGAWISGGIEWNIPHHHRATTFLPVQYRTEKGPDGSWTVWVGELEIRQRMRWAVGYTLRPRSSILECSVRILNRTPVAQSMLCFANVAVSAGPDYQIIFPPSVQLVTYHGKREFTTWPLATTRFFGVDWHGQDASFYRNHTSATSMFAWDCREDFFAGYDHGRDAGTLSIADHHVAPGKKFWTWGNGPHGRMWDRILTDNDGPYVELMVGAYSDNQPDYSWMQPYETRSFVLNWYPFRGIGGVKNANLDAAVNLEVANGRARLGFCSPVPREKARVLLTAAGKVLLDVTTAIDPSHPFRREVVLPAGTDEHDVRATLLSDGRELVSYSPVRLGPVTMPAVVTLPDPPEGYVTDEELDLAGQRIEQFHDPQHDAAAYWLESLRRDPGDTAAHVSLGILDLKAARYAAAEGHFRSALDRLMAKYTEPKDAEPLYYLGVALRGEGRNEEAYDAFFKAAWSQEWKAPAYFQLAELAASRREFPRALALVNQSIDANALNTRALGLKASLLRNLGKPADAQAVVEAAVSQGDPLDVRLMAERWLAEPDTGSTSLLFGALDAHPATAQEIGAEYENAGLCAAALKIPDAAAPRHGGPGRSPIVLYYLADFAEKLGDRRRAAELRQGAATLAPDYVFPFQDELIPVLRRAIAAGPGDARAPYYLGNLLFDGQPAEATALWEQARTLDPTYPVVWRNLAVAYAHSGTADATTRAIAALEKAVSLGGAYPAHLAELDNLYGVAGEPVAKRLALLEGHRDVIGTDDECLARLVTLETLARKPDASVALLKGHTFNIWEGATQFDTGALWLDAHLVLGRKALSAGRPLDALAAFEAALDFPSNLRAIPWENLGDRSIEVAYWKGIAHEALGQADAARMAWHQAASAQAPRPMHRNAKADGWERNIQGYYQALAFKKIGQADRADPVFQKLCAGALPSAPPASRPATPVEAARLHYLAGLGHEGLGETPEARTEFEAALKLKPDLLGAELDLAGPAQ